MKALCIDSQGRMDSFMQTIRSYGQEIDNGRLEAGELSYMMGCGEGELAFSVASISGDIGHTIENCRDQLLLRLGLTGTLTPEQQRLRGWIVGLMCGMELSLIETTLDTAKPANT